jgi:hypothetical protein
MRQLSRVVVGAAVLCSLSVGAAEATRVVSSFEENDPFGLVLSLAFEHTQTRAAILREGTRGDLAAQPLGVEGYQRELFYTGTDSRLNLGLRVGIARDVELHFGVPVVFARNESWRMSAGVTADQSTLLNSCVQPDGSEDCGGPRLLAGAPDSWATYRGGLGNLRFGLAYSVFNQEKDWTKPTWVLSFDYEAPTAQRMDPSLPTVADARAPFGDRNHRYTFATALSRRYGLADPYFRAYYTLPFRGPDWYSNCDSAGAGRLGQPANCGTDAWSRQDTGIQAPHTAGVALGTELLLHDDAKKQTRFALDLNGHVDYVSAGRYYNVLSGLVGKLLRTEDHLSMGGSLGITAAPADFFRLTGALGLSYVTDHALTGEELGRDLDGDPALTGAELNPNFDYRLDAASRRFLAHDMAVFDLRLGLEFSF